MYYPNLWPVLEKSIHSFALSKTVNCGTLACGTGATFRVFQASGGQRVTSVKKVRGARLSQGEERVKKKQQQQNLHPCCSAPRVFVRSPKNPKQDRGNYAILSCI